MGKFIDLDDVKGNQAKESVTARYGVVSEIVKTKTDYKFNCCENQEMKFLYLYKPNINKEIYYYICEECGILIKKYEGIVVIIDKGKNW